jgi:rare lipoprotein A
LAGLFEHLWPGRLASAGVWQPAIAVIPLQWICPILIALAITLQLSGCGSTPKKSEPAKPLIAKSGGYYLDDGPGDNAPLNLDAIADATPRMEPLHRGANRPYTVFGKTYVPNVSGEPFRQQGVASWYGRKFHGNMTSIGETYDMYAMTAAHPTLPLPSYVRVTNPANLKSVVLRVNDRGPFHSDRVIDLSYTAAAKLDIARKGSGFVIVERVFPGDTRVASAPLPTPMPPLLPPPLPPAAPPTTPIITTQAVVPDAGDLYLQLAAFSSAENAEIFRARMSRELEWNREPIQVVQKDNLFRVRMGPYKSREEADAIAAQVRQSHDFSPVIQKP